MAQEPEPGTLTHRQLAELVGGAVETCDGIIRTKDVKPTHMRAIYRVHLECLSCGGRPIVRCTSHADGDALIRLATPSPEEGDVPMAEPVHDHPKRKRKD